MPQAQASVVSCAFTSLANSMSSRNHLAVVNSPFVYPITFGLAIWHIVARLKYRQSSIHDTKGPTALRLAFTQCEMFD
jgi:hypothetical protein